MPLDSQFGLVDVIFGVAALLTVVSVIRSWSTFWDADLTAADKRLATQAAVFLVPPVVVLIHELGHVVAVLAVGAQVLAFHYGLFEGSVTVGGALTPAQGWFVAVAGNVAGAAVGLAMAVVGVRGARLRPALRYVLLLGGVLQVAWALIGYPLLSLSSNWGDWVVIYDFDSTPVLSGATLAVHAGGLYALWRWWRGSVRSTLFAIGSGAGDELARMREAVEARPDDVDGWLRLANLYAGHGELGLARSTLAGAAAGPAGASPRIHLARARLAVVEGQWSSAVVAAEDGLRAAGPDDVDVTQRLWANQGLALASMERPTNALAAFDHLDPPVVDDARVRYGRGLARLGTGDTTGGRADLEAVVSALPEGNLLRRWAEARLQGRVPSPPDDSDRPNYLRRTQSPPAPIAGV
ncbi:MAG: hypothetical protein QOD63_299 [Actinomycetota bacterium]|nr:hypothetical protein [Actinomycetota bacterium]